jgi:hypothetical protein
MKAVEKFIDKMLDVTTWDNTRKTNVKDLYEMLCSQQAKGHELGYMVGRNLRYF